jgi:hypothetical protein
MEILKEHMSLIAGGLAGLIAVIILMVIIKKRKKKKLQQQEVDPLDEIKTTTEHHHDDDFHHTATYHGHDAEEREDLVQILHFSDAKRFFCYSLKVGDNAFDLIKLEPAVSGYGKIEDHEYIEGKHYRAGREFKIFFSKSEKLIEKHKANFNLTLVCRDAQGNIWTRHLPFEKDEALPKGIHLHQRRR